jgi:hypothetical protein
LARSNDVLTVRPQENPVVTALKARALYRTPWGSGKHNVTCPWHKEHLEGSNLSAVYSEPDDQHPVGDFCCEYSHRRSYEIAEVLDLLEVAKEDARHQPTIRIVAGELHVVVDAAEQELARLGRHFQSGGRIVSVSTDTATRDPSIKTTSVPALTRALSFAAAWEKFDSKIKDWVPCDPPPRHTSILHSSQHFNHLRPLAGVTRQPYFDETTGELIDQPGYHTGTQRFGVFDPAQFDRPEPTLHAAREALGMLQEVLSEFRFVGDPDRAAALSAIFTAVTRPTLALAPAFHVQAPVFGSGKTYLCELIGVFAGPARNAKVSYPKTSDEATKVMLSLLLTGPGAVEFDDMDTDWLPHGIMNRILTTDSVTDRILGVSKTATVSTRTLILGSGNNVGPVRDLRRRVLTIHMDPRCSTPALLAYKGQPVERVRSDRGRYVAAVLTIIEAWRRAGSPRTACGPIASFNGAWSDYCRYPLMWLGLPDPATSLLEQIQHDPEADALLNLMKAWRAAFGFTPTTVRTAVAKRHEHPELIDAIRELPIEDRGEVNRNKLGWHLKRNANRIVQGLEFQRAEANGRVAWKVVGVESQPQDQSAAIPDAPLIDLVATASPDQTAAMH